MRLIKNGLLAAALLSTPALAADFETHNTENTLSFQNISIEHQVSDNQFDIDNINVISGYLANSVNAEGVRSFGGGVDLVKLLKPLALSPRGLSLIANNKPELMKNIVEGDIKHDSYGSLTNEALLALLKLNADEFNSRTGGPEKWEPSTIEDLLSTLFKFSVPKILGELRNRNIDIASFMKEHATKEQFDALTFMQLGVHDSEYLSINVDYKDAITGEDKTLDQLLFNGCLCKSNFANDDKLVVIDVYDYEYSPKETHIVDVLSNSKTFFIDKAKSKEDLDVYHNLEDEDDGFIKSISVSHNSTLDLEHKFWLEGRDLNLQAFSENASVMFLEVMARGHNLPSYHADTMSYAKFKMYKKTLASDKMHIEDSDLLVQSTAESTQDMLDIPSHGM